MRSIWSEYKRQVRLSFSREGRSAQSPWDEDREWPEHRPATQHEWALLFVVAAIMIGGAVLALR